MQLYQTNVRATETTRFDEGLRAFMIRVFNNMAVGLVVTAITSWMFATIPALMGLIYKLDPVNGAPIGTTSLGYCVAFAPLIFAFMFGSVMRTMSVNAVRGLFYAFSALMGVSLSYIFLFYTGASIASTFFITAAMFASMALYGNVTKKDLTSFGSFLMMGLIGVIIASVVNLFLGSPALMFAVSILTVFIFLGMTAYDVQSLKRMYLENSASEELVQKISIYGAFSLYMNFINLFVNLLRLFGDRKN